MIELTVDEIRTLIIARDLLYTKLVPQHSHYKVERAHQALCDVLRQATLPRCES